jgi:glycosyltransferase involved in cell wall biosynthesis
MGGELVGLADIGYGGQLVLTNRALTAFSLRASNCITIASSRGIVRLEAMLGTRSSHRLVRLVWGVDPTLVASIDPPLPLRGGFRLVHVGSLIPVKDQTMLLHAFRRVRAVQKDAHLHIVGGGPLRQSLESLAASLGLDKSISFHGPVRREDLAGYYRACHALVVSSRHEMQPVVALEAALCRLPIVGCDIGVVSDLAPHAALAVPVGDDAAMSDALLSLVSEQPRLTLGAAAHDWVRSSCLASHTANQLMALYRDVRRTARESRAGLLRQDHTHETGVSLGEPAGD